MPQEALGGLPIVHSLITTVIGVVAVANPNASAMTLPSWFSWWPRPFGRSWLIEALGLGSGASLVVGGLIWLVVCAALVAAGLGWIGLPPVRDVWQPLALVGAAIGLVALALDFHPLYFVAVGSDLGVRAAPGKRACLTTRVASI